MGGGPGERGRRAAPARERIAARPPAFGPMDHGPAVYRDVHSEEMRLLQSFAVRTVFPEDVRREVARLPADPRPRDFAGRADLRGARIFTIDGEDARDFDDAIGIRELPGGNVELGVHIADVGHYVRPGTALDAEALARGTSIYLPDQVVPMLPEELSNHLCSLVPERDRLAYSVILEFAPDGQRVAARVHKSVIRSVRRNTYRGVQDLLDGRRTGAARAARPLRDDLEVLQRWTLQQQRLREQRGVLRIDLPERRFVFDGDHRVTAIVQVPKLFAQTLIEETALAANQAVGDLFHERGLPTIYRVHPEKDPAAVAAVARELAEHGLRVPDKENLTTRDVGRLIRLARRRPNAEGLIRRILGLIERATYAVRDRREVATHFGLLRESYLHFTSPIRRYPDLVVHRWLHAIESGGAAAARRLRAADLLGDLNDEAAHSSERAELAEMAARAVADLKVCQFVAPHTGEAHDAEIVRVSAQGLELRLPRLGITGFLPAHELGGRAELDGPALRVRDGGGARSFREGRTIRVLVAAVDFDRLQVLFALEPEPQR